ncbi:hypothetical protein MLD38_031682 [Melastoma candidum]|uniref:Uncharacterized protein n=1 Tax=Melastoma candidum TaxID=119954 RepID=A0ACB9MV44_9MYRT|nr:hypothetical protein MLD38_031682 [Melastoma candidum]
MESRVDDNTNANPALPPRTPDPAPSDPVRSLSRSKYSDRVLLVSILQRDDLGAGLAGERVVVGGWVKTSKEERKETLATQNLPGMEEKPAPAEVKDTSCAEMFQTRIPIIRTIMKVFGGGGHPVKPRAEGGGAMRQASSPPPPPPPVQSVAFLQVSDGSCIPSLLILVDSSVASLSHLLPTGTSVLIEGLLRQPSTRGKHAIELQAEKVLHIGTVHQESYLLSKKRLPLDSLRSALQFRPRTTTVACVVRIRNAACFASRTFFHDHGFLEVHLPIITTTDGEGQSQKFRVTVLPKRSDVKKGNDVATDAADVSLDVVRASMNEKTKKVEELKRSDSNKEVLVAAIQDLKKVNELAMQLEMKEKKQKDKEVKLSEDYFPDETYLTVSGRLHLQSYACALGQVYSFEPRFRADRTESPKLLAEMWTLEVEMAFSALEDAMKCAEDYLKFLCKWVLDSCPEEMKFIAKRVDKTCTDRLRSAISKPWQKITYSEAIHIWKRQKEKTDIKVELPVSLTDEDLSYLADQIYKSPLIVYNPPKETKPFYARVNDDGVTVSAFDLVLPGVGKIITGTQNEERMDILSNRIKEMGLAREQYEWHLELLKQGAVKSSGFSFSFDIMLLFATGLTDVRDVVPFPRSPGGKVHC